MGSTWGDQTIQWLPRKTPRRLTQARSQPAPQQRRVLEPRRRSGPRERCAKSLTTWSCSINRHTTACWLKINGSLARRAITKLLEAGLIRPVEKHSRQQIYTRNVGDDEAEE